MVSTISDHGIIIRVVDRGEADKLVTLITAKHGLVNLFAKGVRSLRSRRAGHIDVLNQVSFQTSRHLTPRYLADIVTLNNFSNIRHDLKKTHRLFMFFEILSKLIPEEQSDPPLYQSLLNYLSSLNASDSSVSQDETDMQFGLYLLRHTGYPPPPELTSGYLFSYFETILGHKLTSLSLGE